MESQTPRPRSSYLAITSTLTTLLLFLLLIANVFLLIRSMQKQDLPKTHDDVKPSTKVIKSSFSEQNGNIGEKHITNSLDALHNEVHMILGHFKTLENHLVNEHFSVYYDEYPFSNPSYPFMAKNKLDSTQINTGLNSDDKSNIMILSSDIVDDQRYVKWEAVDKSELVDLNNVKFAKMEIVNGKIVIRAYMNLSKYLKGQNNCKNFYRLKSISNVPYKSITGQTIDYSPKMGKNDMIITCKEYADELVRNIISQYLDECRMALAKNNMGKTHQQLSKPNNLALTNPPEINSTNSSIGVASDLKKIATSDSGVVTPDIVVNVKDNLQHNIIEAGAKKKNNSESDESMDVIEEDELCYDYFAKDSILINLDESTFENLLPYNDLMKQCARTPSNSLDNIVNEASLEENKRPAHIKPEGISPSEVCIPLWIDGECLGLQISEQLSMPQNQTMTLIDNLNTSSNTPPHKVPITNEYEHNDKSTSIENTTDTSKIGASNKRSEENEYSNKTKQTEQMEQADQVCKENEQIAL